MNDYWNSFRLRRLCTVFIVLVVLMAELFPANCLLVYASDPTAGVGNKTYLIKNYSSGKYLTYSNSGLALSSYTGEDSQKWQIEHFSNGSVRLVSLKDFAYWYGDRNVVYAYSSTNLGIAVGSSSLQADTQQCWNLNGTLQYCSIVSSAFTSYRLASSVSNTPCLSTSSNGASSWVLIECSNSYVLPEATNGTFNVNKYNSQGNNGLLYKMNCYAYAVGYYGEYYCNSAGNIDNNLYDEVQPGYMSDNQVDSYALSTYFDWDSVNNRFALNDDGVSYYANAIIDALDTDLQYMFNESFSTNRIFPSSASEIMTGPWKKVALVISSYAVDYHWFIESSDGIWSHKPGSGSVTQEDFGSPATTITAPDSCNLGIYDHFVGYYKIRIDSIPDPVLSPASMTNDIYDYEKDNAGDIPSMARNLGVISPGVHYLSTDFYCAMEYSSAVNNYDCTDISNGKVVTRTFIWDADADWFEFTVSQTGTYNIYSGSCSEDLYGALYSPSGVLLDEDDDTGTGYNFSMSVSLSAGVLYRLCVSSFADDSDTFTYSISFY